VRHLRTTRAIAAGVALFGALGLSLSSRQAPSAMAWLERYARGEFEPVVDTLARATDFDSLREQLERDAPAWIAAGGDRDRARRELAAATFALEAARADEWNEWKLIQTQPPMGAPGGKGGSYQPRPVIYWKPAPRLIEWGCKLMSRDPAPRPIERWWQLAALAVAQRSEDFQFLVGNPFDQREYSNPQDEIEHLLHVIKRFPDEPRFNLAQGIAVEWRWPEQAATVFAPLISDWRVGGEAAMRLGRIRAQGRGTSNALDALDRAERLTRDRYVVYLARFFRGQYLERSGRIEDAEKAYRSAVATVPHAQSATVALSTLLFGRDHRTEAQTLTSAMLAARPQPVDPWRVYAHADDRFWPQLIARLRKEIAR
jgi:tetratricopeptide (TPR) repeat protein